MDSVPGSERLETIVIGGGQAGLAVGYQLAQRGLPFAVLDASERIGDSWRNRWDSLRLFTPARYNGLPGMRFPAPPHSFPTKDEMGDFLEHYARAFDLPVRSGVRVDRVSRNGDGWVVEAGERRMVADNVVVAMANYQEPWVPDFGAELDPAIVQLHSADYRNPGQLRPGGVLLVGGGNSGSEIAMELSADHEVIMSGRDTGQIPFRASSLPGRLLLTPLLLRFVFRRILSIHTPMGRALRAKIMGHGGPLIRVKRTDLAAAGVVRVGRVVAVSEGRPELVDGQVLDVENVVWCTGFRTGFESWIDVPVHDEHEPIHDGGIVPDQPGLFFTGLHFLRSMASAMIQGAGDDSVYIANAVAERSRALTAGRRAIAAHTGGSVPADDPGRLARAGG